MKQITLIILAVVTILAGSVSCQKDDITPECSIRSVSMSIIPDFSDGSVYSYSNDGSFFLRISVSPEEFLANIENNDSFICKADFRCMITKATTEYSDFTIIGKITSASVEEGYMTTFFTLTKDEMVKLQEADYMVSFSIKAGDGTHGATTSYVPMSYQRVGQGGEIEMPEGALPGLFTVAPNGKQVYFSQGNLWYGKLTEDAAEATWNLEENQYGIGLGERITSDEGINFLYYWLENHVSHFFWTNTSSEAYQQYMKGSGFDKALFTNLKSDVCKPNPEFTANGQKGIWRALTLMKDSGEWDYLLNRRTMTYGKPRYTDKTCAKVQAEPERPIVAGEYAIIEGNEYSGLFIYPDDYDGNEIGTDGAPDTWQEINAAGIVFLPVTGYRISADPRDIRRIENRKTIGDKIRGIEEGNCQYWAAGYDGRSGNFDVYYFSYHRTVGPLSYVYKRLPTARCIRLVTDAN